MSETSIPVTPTVSTPAPAPAPAPAPQSAPAPTPQALPNRAVFPTIDVSGAQVNPLGQKLPGADDIIDFAELDAPPKKASKKPSAPATPSAPEAPAGAAAQPQPAAEASSAPEEPGVTDSPFVLEANSAPTKPAGRNYAELPPEIQNLAKKLPNAVYNHLVETHKKFQADLTAERTRIAELTKAVEESSGRVVTDSPEAYKIDPQYNEVVTNFGRTTTELDHYTNQLARIEAGESWSYIEGYDAQNNPVYKEVAAPADGKIDYRAKATLQRAMQQLVSSQNELNQRAVQIQAYYRNSATEVQQHYAEAKTRLFKDLDPTKLTDENEKKVYEYAINALPKIEQRRPSAQLLGLAAIQMRRVLVTNQKLLERAERAERMLKTQAAADPVRPTPNSGAAPGEGEQFINWESLG